LPVGEVFGKTIAYNVLAKIAGFEDSGYTGEEAKMMAEPRKILGAPDLVVSATAVRVPVITGHAVSILARFVRAISAEEARAVLASAPGVTLMDDPANGIYPSPLEAAGRDGALVGRVRQGPDANTLLMFSCADNLRIGAALDAVEIAEHLFSR
jgi:aspartate-semialdehyde dehydrogenase